MVNKVVLIGNLGRDPELFQTQGGRAVARVSIATNEVWTRNGERQRRTEWHRVVVWGRGPSAPLHSFARGHWSTSRADSARAHRRMEKHRSRRARKSTRSGSCLWGVEPSASASAAAWVSGASLRVSGVSGH